MARKRINVRFTNLVCLVCGQELNRYGDCRCEDANLTVLDYEFQCDSVPAVGNAAGNLGTRWDR